MTMMNSSEPTDKEMESCFGTKTKCNRNCRMKEYCLSEAKEKKEETRRRKFRETPFLDELDSESEDHHANRDYLAKQEQPGEETTSDEIIRAIKMLDVPDTVRNELKRLCKQRDKEEKQRIETKELLARLGELFVFNPAGFEAMFFQILTGCNQTMLAKMHQCSKQNISKRLAKDRKTFAEYKQKGKPMSGRELAVYYYAFVKKESRRETARILGIPKSTVQDITQKLFIQKVLPDKLRKFSGL